MPKSFSGRISTRSTRRFLHYLPLLTPTPRWPLLYSEKGLSRTRATSRRRWESETTSYVNPVPEELSVADIRMDVNRLAWSRHPSHAYSTELSARPCAWQANLTWSQSRAGDPYNLTSRSVVRYQNMLVPYLKSLPTARFSTYHSRRTRAHLSATNCTGRPIRPECRRSKLAASHGTPSH